MDFEAVADQFQCRRHFHSPRLYQGQTLQYVDIDCYSFFAAGQMGVAVGRVQPKAGLRVKNFNKGAATLKHPSCVYDFYNNMNVFSTLIYIKFVRWYSYDLSIYANNW
jgi:hypothetical protein